MNIFSTSFVNKLKNARNQIILAILIALPLLVFIGIKIGWKLFEKSNNIPGLPGLINQVDQNPSKH